MGPPNAAGGPLPRNTGGLRELRPSANLIRQKWGRTDFDRPQTVWPATDLAGNLCLE